jgi:hypothetical protein
VYGLKKMGSKICHLENGKNFQKYKDNELYKYNCLGPRTRSGQINCSVFGPKKARSPRVKKQSGEMVKRKQSGEMVKRKQSGGGMMEKGEPKICRPGRRSPTNNKCYSGSKQPKWPVCDTPKGCNSWM